MNEDDDCREVNGLFQRDKKNVRWKEKVLRAEMQLRDTLHWQGVSATCTSRELRKKRNKTLQLYCCRCLSSVRGETL